MFKTAQGFGSSARESPDKKYYFFFAMAVMLFLFWARIGVASPESRSMIDFYLLFGGFGLMFMLADYIGGKSLGFIDTVTIEKPMPMFSFLTTKTNLIIGSVFGILLSLIILQKQTAWISYPKFLIGTSQTFNSVLSGMAGIVENWVFFSILFVTLYNNFDGNKISAFLKASAITSFIFMFFHIFVYSVSAQALFATASFAIINCLLVATTRTIIYSDFLHFFNNYTASQISAAVMLFFKL